MRILLSLLLLGSASHAAESTSIGTPTASLVPVVLGGAPSAKQNSYTSVSTPKIHSVRATRNADGSLAVGCVERPNPKSKVAPIASPAARAQQ